MSAEWGGPTAVADMLVEAIQYNANILGHYVLHAFVVVPNHVHLRADPAVTLPKLTKSLKRHHCQASQHDVGIDGKPLLAGRAMTTWCGMRGSSRRSGTALRGILCGQGWCGKPASTDGRALGRSWGGPIGRLRPAPWRNRDQMHTQPLRSGCLGRHTRKIVEVLLPGGWASPRLITTQTGSVLGCMSRPCGLVWLDTVP